MPAIKKYAIKLANFLTDLENLVLSRVKRKVKKIKFQPNRCDINNLLTSLNNIPSNSHDVTSWTQSTSKLIKKTMLEKLTYDEISLIIAGLIAHNRAGFTPKISQTAFVQAYEKTNGAAQEILHASLSKPSNNSTIVLTKAKKSIIGDLSPNQLSEILNELTREGYAKLPIKIPPEALKLLLEEAKNISFNPLNGTSPGRKINPGNLNNNGIYHCKIEDLQQSNQFSSIANDPFIKYIADKYLNTNTTLINQSLKYTFPSPRASSQGAQLFHYDLDTLRWLKVFIYLNNITTEMGPHEYVKGSHVPGNKPTSLLLRGYQRISDTEIDHHYRGKRIKLAEPAGTIIFADTRCYHKGNVPTEGYRLMFTLNFAPSKLCYSQL